MLLPFEVSALKISQSFSKALVLSSSKHPEYFQYLLCMGEVKAHITGILYIYEKIRLKGIYHLIFFRVTSLPEAKDHTRANDLAFFW